MARIEGMRSSGVGDEYDYDDDALVELTAIVAWENASSKFNRALRIPSQGLWRRSPS